MNLTIKDGYWQFCNSVPDSNSIIVQEGSNITDVLMRLDPTTLFLKLSRNSILLAHRLSKAMGSPWGDLCIPEDCDTRNKIRNLVLQHNPKEKNTCPEVNLYKDTWAIYESNPEKDMEYAVFEGNSTADVYVGSIRLEVREDKISIYAINCTFLEQQVDNINNICRVMFDGDFSLQRLGSAIVATKGGGCSHSTDYLKEYFPTRPIYYLVGSSDQIIITSNPKNYPLDCYGKYYSLPSAVNNAFRLSRNVFMGEDLPGNQVVQ